jgi:hypothetical protein
MSFSVCGYHEVQHVSEQVNDLEKLMDILEKVCPMEQILLQGVPQKVCEHNGTLAFND